ncbi:MAG TPA: signal peptide peptidase SppA [Moorella mulderi]|nr:signal peptide peptidase SppA [Moorella mulderi]
MTRKRWIALLIVIGLFLGGIAASAHKMTPPSLGFPAKELKEERITGTGKDRIALLRLEGVIIEEEGKVVPARGFSYQRFLEELEQAQRDGSIKAVILRINSPGGSAVLSDEIYHALKNFRTKAEKPLVVSMAEVAASGGYYVSTAADKILANPNTLTGSIGVIFTLPNYEKLANTIGYKEIVIKSGPLKDMGNPFREMTPEERAAFQSLVDDTFNRFVDLVAQERKMPREEVLKIATGQVYTGAQAKTLGLVDDLGDLNKAIETAKELAGLKEATVISYVRPKGFWAWLMEERSQRKQLWELVKAYLGPSAPTSAHPQLLYLWCP